MSSGKGSKKIVTGYWYYLDVLLGLCHGPVDSINKIAVGGRTAWSGSVTSNTALSIDKENLFGGTKREGGVKGTVRVMMGGKTQIVSGSLASTRGANSPAYRGLACLFFEKFAWAANNPYFKPPAVEVTRRLKGWHNDSVWYSEKCAIGTADMNPAHIIFECMTNPAWGMGYGEADLDASTVSSSFKTAADQLHAEGFGLSLPWMQQSSIEDFVRIIIDHIGAAVQFDVALGQFTLRLVRGGYDLNDPTECLPVSPANAKLGSFQRAAWGETANEVVVVYKDRSGQNVSLSVQDAANIQIQGAVVSVTKQYPGIPSADLAGRVAQRDLAAASSPLAKIEFTINRSGSRLKTGDIINFTWEPVGITQAAYRVVSVDRGSLLSGEIKCMAVEDVFGIDSQTYVGTEEGGGWTPTASNPVALTPAYQYVLEAPYYYLERNLPDADLAYLGEGEGFASFLASYPDTGAYNFTLMEDTDGAGAGTEWLEVGTGQFSTTVVLTPALPLEPVSTGIPVTSLREFEDLAECVGLTGLIVSSAGQEIVVVDAVNTGVDPVQVSLSRGAIDTVPLAHPAGAVLWMDLDSLGAVSDTTHVLSEEAHYRALARTRLGILPADDVTLTTAPLVFSARKDRPYPPGKFAIGAGAYSPQHYPASLPGGDILVQWAHRNRLTQTVDAPVFLTNSVTAEAGTTYTVAVYDVSGGGSGVLKRTTTGITTGSWTYTGAMESADGGPFTVVRVKMWAVRGGFDSRASHDWTFDRSGTSGLGENLGLYLGGV